MGNLSTTSDEILQCARALIVAGGYNGFSYADIAAVVGIRKASIHHHFPAKADLVREVVVRYRAAAAAGFAALESTVVDPVERLRAYVGYWQACITDASEPFCACAMLAGQMPLLPESVVLEVRTHFRDLTRWVAAVLESGAGQGRLRFSGSAEAEAELFVATVHGAMLSARATGDSKIFVSITQSSLARLVT